MSQDAVFQGARILLGLTGGISVYKGAELTRWFMRRGAAVRVLMTRAAQEFITPLTLETLSGQPVYTDVFSRGHAWRIEHIAYARWGRVLVVAPATANTIAKLAAGIADDPVSTTALAFRGPLVAAPAMNAAMWDHPQTRRNLETLRERGVRIVMPGEGELACGESGSGRLADPDVVGRAVGDALEAAARGGPLAGRNVLITAGPTAEPIDPVRWISNPSTGRMGLALAAEAEALGARVTLVLGPTPLDPPPSTEAEVVRVKTAEAMRDAVLERLAAQDVCVFSAAVADYAPETFEPSKRKKQGTEETLVLRLKRTPDVAAAAAAARRPGQVFIGFAAETGDLEANARDKMRRKGFDAVAANLVSPENPAFGAGANAMTLFAADGASETLPPLEKNALAAALWEFCCAHTPLGAS